VGSNPGTGGAVGIDGRLAVVSSSPEVGCAGTDGGMEGLGAVTSSSNAGAAFGTTGGAGASRATGGEPAKGAAAGTEGDKARSPRVTGKIPWQTLQRARTPAGGTFAGSTR
jgi:hypothetical protein